MISLEPCCDCGCLPKIRDNSSGTSVPCVKWYACDCGRTGSWRGCGTRVEAAKKWNTQIRFVRSYREGKKCGKSS